MFKERRGKLDELQIRPGALENFDREQGKSRAAEFRAIYALTGSLDMGMENKYELHILG